MKTGFEPDALKEKINVPSQIPEWIHERMDDTLRHLEQNKKNRNITRKTAVLLAACISVTSIGALTAFGQHLPIVRTLIEFVNPSAGKNYEAVKTDIHKSTTDQGITFTVNDLSYDGATLLAGISVNKPGGFERDEIDINLLPRLSGTQNPVPWKSANAYLSRQENGYYTGYASFALGDAELPSQFTLSFVADEIEKVNGLWKVDTDVSKDKIYVTTDVNTIHQEHSLGDGTVKDVKIIRSALNTIVTIQGTYDGVFPEDMKTFLPRFFILDDAGNCLNYSIMDERLGADKNFSTDIKILDIPEGTKKLTILPYRRVSAKESRYTADIANLPAVITVQDKEIQIEKTEYSEGKFKMYYTVGGMADERQFTYFDFIDKDGERVDVPSMRMKPLDYTTGVGTFAFETDKPEDIVKIACYGYEYQLMTNYRFKVPVK